MTRTEEMVSLYQDFGSVVVRRCLTCELLLDTITEYREEKGYPPSYRDLSELAKRPLTTVDYHLRHLREAGRVRQEPGKRRSLVVIAA